MAPGLVIWQKRPIRPEKIARQRGKRGSAAGEAAEAERIVGGEVLIHLIMCAILIVLKERTRCQLLAEA
jgi:hypothetical protein